MFLSKASYFLEINHIMGVFKESVLFTHTIGYPANYYIL